jgi:hypothetical protein
MADIFDRMKPRDIAIAMVAAQKIMMHALIEAGALDRQRIQQLLADKSQELLTEKFEEGAGQLLLMMSGFVRKNRPGEREP